MKNIIHRIEHGDDFRKDGWVYSKKKRMRKWFSNLIDEHGCQAGVIWEPKLDNIPLLEIQRWRAVQYQKKFHEKVWTPVFNALWEVKQAHVKVDKGWLLYEAHDNGIGRAFGFSWVDKPQKPLHLKVGEKMVQIEERQKEVFRRVAIAKAAFHMAIRKYFRQIKDPTIPGQTGRLVVNGRIYWFVTVMNRHGVVMWDAMAFPESHVVDFEL